MNTLLYPSRKSFFVDETSYTVIDEEKYSLLAFVKLMDEKTLNLKISSPSVDFKKGLRLMNTKIRHDLEKITVEKRLAVEATIIAAIGIKQEPQLYLSFKVRDNLLTIGTSKIPIEHVTFDGYLRSIDSTRTMGDMTTAVLNLQNITGRVYDFPFNAAIAITNFKDPKIKIDGKIVVEGEEVKTQRDQIKMLLLKQLDYKH